MKILSLQIQGYKNLKDKTKASFDFSKCTNYVALEQNEKAAWIT